MKKLLIIRHAEAADAESEDKARALTNNGLSQAHQLGKNLVKSGFVPELILASSATRAQQTTEQILAGMMREQCKVQTAENLYYGRLYDIIKLIQSVDDGVQQLMVVGHNPSFTELVNALSETGIDHLNPCGACLLDFEIEHWTEIENTKGQLSQITCE